MSIQKKLIPNTPDGGIFEVGGIQFIKFPGEGDMVPVVAKDVLFRSQFGDNNDLRQSEVLKKLEADILPRIIDAVGEENLRTVHTDLTTLDGLKPYGVMESLISLPTMDFYREQVEIFDQHKPDHWWWLATPESAKPHDSPWWILCVSPSGGIGDGGCNLDRGVRPFLIFKSSIFESSEE